MRERPWQRHYDYDVPFTIRYPRIPAHALLSVPATAFPDKAALNFYGTELTFWELRRRVIRMANALAGIGVARGDRVGLHLPTCPQYVIAFHAVLHLGAIVVNMNPMYTLEELTLQVGNAGISTLFTFDMVLPNIFELCRRVEMPRVVVTRVVDYIQGFGESTPEDLGLPPDWHHFSLLMQKGSDRSVPRVEIAQDDPALIQFTGGTTGIPKGAVLTHGNLVAATLQVSLWGGGTTNRTPPERRCVLSVLPYFHVYGTIVAMTWGLFNAATQILVPRFEIDELMGILEKFPQITFFPAVPTMIHAVIRHPKAEALELERRFGLLNSGGAPMPLETIEKVKDMGINYSEGWGMSETTSLGISNPVLGLRKAGSIGIPWPDTDVRIVDVEDGTRDVPVGAPGEILIRSPLVMKGYWNDSGETAGQLTDGWLHTGDIGQWDEDRYITIVDRKKDMIIAGGYNIYPREIDEVLYRHPKIQDGVAVGIPDAYRGETVKAFVVLKPGETCTETEILAFCRERLAAYKAPKRVEFREALPKSAVGKILRKVLRKEEETKSRSTSAKEA